MKNENNKSMYKHWYNWWTALQIGSRCNPSSIFLQNETFRSTLSPPFCKRWSEKWNEVVGAYVNHLHRQYRQPVSANMHITIIASPPCRAMLPWSILLHEIYMSSRCRGYKVKATVYGAWYSNILSLNA